MTRDTPQDEPVYWIPDVDWSQWESIGYTDNGVEMQYDDEEEYPRTDCE